MTKAYHLLSFPIPTRDVADPRYSNDGFGNKERKEFESKEDLLKLLKGRFELDQIKGYSNKTATIKNKPL